MTSCTDKKSFHPSINIDQHRDSRRWLEAINKIDDDTKADEGRE